MTQANESFEQKLDAALEKGFKKYARGLARETLRNLFSPKKRYARILANLSHHGDSVEAVIREAAERSGTRAELRADFLKHEEEERGHGRIAAKDLQALNVDEGFKATLSPTSAQLALSAYTHEIARSRPVAVLGFLAAAEGLTYRYAEMGVRGLKRIGVPEKALHFLTLHAEVDRDHFPQLRAMALKHAQTAEEQQAVLEAVRVTSDLLTLAQRH